MTTERTPQDVLRELREGVGQIARWPVFDEHDGSPASYGNLIDYRAALGLIDSAIAEAPDSLPHDPDDPPGVDVVELVHEVRRERRNRPDTLSEKPGLDVERLAAAICATREPFVEASADLFVDDECRRRADLIAAEYDRLGSTDSEGR